MLQRVFLFTISLSACFVYSSMFSQCLGKKDICKRIVQIENNASLSALQKLSAFYALKKTIETCGVKSDSVYAWVYLKLGKYESVAKNNYEGSLSLTQTALNINKNSPAASSHLLNLNGCYNIASAYEALLLYSKALNYYDSVIFLSRNYSDTINFLSDARLRKAAIYFSSGDYQMAVEESIKGMRLAEIQNDLYTYTSFLNMKAQSLYFENDIQQSLTDAHNAVVISKKINDINELAAAYKTLALSYSSDKLLNNDSSAYYFKQTINARLKSGDNANISRDYVDIGNFYLNNLQDYKNAANYYKQFFLYADKISDPVEQSIEKAATNLNIGESYFQQNKLGEAETYYLKSFNILKLNIENIKINPTAVKLNNFSSNTDVIMALMIIKTKLLLRLYKNKQQPEFVNACIKTALVTDSVITQIRHEHLGEQSKLYWRNRTRQFYANAIEACYLANNTSLAFYFMEKSRAVLLSDKINELNASAYLPQTKTRKEEDYKIKISELEQKLLNLNDTSLQYKGIQSQLLSVKENFEQYIKSLEQNYRAYYQYKYNDEVPSIKSLQASLVKNNQSFVYYFLSDTITYMLAITANSTKFIRLSDKEFNKEQLTQFLQLCADKEALNNDYDLFAALSNSLYKKIFKPLSLPKGRIIICTDAVVIPFEALCTDVNGKNFLLNDYSFSYVYSAGFLITRFKNETPKGDFIGFSPVSFASYLNVQDLKNSADALHAAAAYYKNDKLFVHTNATRNSFFNYACSYSIINIFSHARADTTGSEPVLYMQDSLIHLSELQLLNHPATELVLLSACQTNVGKSATGEGIYSLARGFAAAGIPCVAATLWKADEQSVYSISEKFNQYLSEGMRKDEALQKAKLYFIQHNTGNEKLLPYYWANMILIGNAEPVNFIHTSSNFAWSIIAGCLLLMLVFIFIYTKRKVVVRKNEKVA